MSLCKVCNKVLYNDANVEIFLSILVFLILILYCYTDFVVLLITYENDGVLRVAELVDHYCLLLKSRPISTRALHNYIYPPRYGPVQLSKAPLW